MLAYRLATIAVRDTGSVARKRSQPFMPSRAQKVNVIINGVITPMQATMAMGLCMDIPMTSDTAA